LELLIVFAGKRELLLEVAQLESRGGVKGRQELVTPSLQLIKGDSFGAK